MTKQVVVIDYGIGNVFSVCNALSRIGASPILSGDPVVIAKAERVILPGVGAFSKAMENLRSLGLDDAIATFIDTGRPFLGICIGMQVLMERSSEFGNHAGLGYIKGSVERISDKFSIRSSGKVPHVGWAEIRVCSNSLSSSNFLGQCDRSYFYFLHSYVCKTMDTRDLVGTVQYSSADLPAIVSRENVVGVQFHPERSGAAGLRFLNDFIKFN